MREEHNEGRACLLGKHVSQTDGPCLHMLILNTIHTHQTDIHNRLMLGLQYTLAYFSQDKG